MSTFTRFIHRSATALLVMAALVIGLGVWGQIEQSRLNAERADAMIADGIAGFNAVPVPLILQPFENGQIPAVLLDDAGQGTVFGVFAKIGGAIGLFGLLLATLRGRTVAGPATEIGDQGAAMAMPKVASRSDWQTRLAQKSAGMAEKPIGTKRQGASRSVGKALYRALLIMVGAAFVTVSAAFIMGKSGIDGSGNLDSFGLTDVDIAGQIDWLVQTGNLAMAGDQAAIMTLGMVGGSIFVVLILLRALFSRRKPRRNQRDRFADLH